MTQKRKTTRSKKHAPTMLFPVPPQDEQTEDLSVEIRSAVGWRLKMALFRLEAEGAKTTKKAFVEQALVEVLDKFDRTRA